MLTGFHCDVVDLYSPIISFSHIAFQAEILYTEQYNNDK